MDRELGGRVSRKSSNLIWAILEDQAGRIWNNEGLGGGHSSEGRASQKAWRSLSDVRQQFRFLLWAGSMPGTGTSTCCGHSQRKKERKECHSSLLRELPPGAALQVGPMTPE